MRKIGLVLAGGGGKGAYQIGVWKALREFGVEGQVVAVAGTSVGALNAALFVEGDLEKAEDIWLNISPEKILTVDPSRILLGASRLPSRLFSLIESISTRLIGHGWFSRAGLLDIIRKDVHLSLVSSSTIPCFATCIHASRLTAEYFELNGSNHKRIESILLASSAIPFVFDPVEIDGEMYWDGGLPLKNGDNLPIKPLYDKGCDLIIAVHLSRDQIINRRDFPNAEIVEIIPQDHQGGLFSGTLNFTPSGSKRRMNQGYNDTKKILQPIIDMMLVQMNMTVKLKELQSSERKFGKERDILQGERIQLKQNLSQYIKK